MACLRMVFHSGRSFSFLPVDFPRIYVMLCGLHVSFFLKYAAKNFFKWTDFVYMVYYKR